MIWFPRETITSASLGVFWGYFEDLRLGRRLSRSESNAEDGYIINPIAWIISSGHTLRQNRSTFFFFFYKKCELDDLEPLTSSSAALIFPPGPF